MLFIMNDVLADVQEKQGRIHGHPSRVQVSRGSNEYANQAVIKQGGIHGYLSRVREPYLRLPEHLGRSSMVEE